MQVDIVDFNGSFLARVRDFAGANPIILVITKVVPTARHFTPYYLSSLSYQLRQSFLQVDLLPRDTDLNCIGDWVVESVVKKKLKYSPRLLQFHRYCEITSPVYLLSAASLVSI
jgi:nitric-oxide synthase, plant